MDYAYSLSGRGAPLKMGFQIGETGFVDAGIVALEPDVNSGGVAMPTTTDLSNAVGVTIDAADTFVTAQQTDGTSAEREVTIIIQPDAVYRILMSGGGTEGTALTQIPITTAASDGLTLTTSSITNWASPTFDEGTVWFDDGPNVGAKRRVISVSSTVATVEVAFDQGTVVGDNLLRAPWWFLGLDDLLQTTALFYQADASIAHTTGGAIKTIDMELNSVSDSFLLFILDDHALGQTRS